MHKSLLKYKKPYYFKNHSIYEDYIYEQLNIYVQDEDLESIKALIDTNEMNSDYAIMKMSKCPTSALPFYARYLFYESINIIEGIKILIQRFFDDDKKLEIYNSIRPLVNHLDLSKVLSLLDQGHLSILVGEYGRKHNLPFEKLGLKNLDLKFLGYFTTEEMGEMKDIDKFIKMDINIMKIVTMWDHPNLINILKSNDFKNNNLRINFYLRFYLEKCSVNLDLLKKLPFDYDPYTLYLLLDKLRDDEAYCKSNIKELTLEKMTLVRVLFTTDKEWLRKYSESDLEENILEENILEENMLEEKILNCINSFNDNLFHFNAFKKLNEFAPKEKLLQIDKILFEKSMINTIEKYINKDLPVNIEKWMSINEVYFSLVLRKIPSLFSFHTSVMFNKKKISQMAEDILKSNDRDLFLMYLDKRGIYVDFLGLEEIEYDFSINWLKIFINENTKKIKEIKKHDKMTTKIELQNDKDILLIINPTKIDELNISNESIKINGFFKRVDDLTTKGVITKEICINDRPKNDITNNLFKTPKKLKLISLDEQYLLDIYNGRSPTRDFNRFGVLNKFISFHLHDLEGCARVTATVVRDNKQLEDFLKTISFVIEDDRFILKFMHHLLKCIKFTIPLALVRKWANGIGAIPLAGKIVLNDLNTLFDFPNMEISKEDLTTGILLRGYSYLLRDRPIEGKFRKVKDIDITFYYFTTLVEVKIKYQNDLISYSCIDKEGYLSLMRIFVESKCSFKREIVSRCIKVLGVDFKKVLGVEFKNNTTSVLDYEKETILNLFIKDPKTNLNLLCKLVQDGHELDKKIAFILIDLLHEIRGDQEENILEILRNHPIDKEMTIYILNYFEYYSYSTKLRIISFLKGPRDLKVFVKYCEIIGNEENLEVLRIILEDLRDRKVYFSIIEKWKVNPKLNKLLKRIYPLGMKDKEFYSGLKWSNEEEKDIIEKVFKKK